MTILLDTTVLIDALRRRPPVLRYIDSCAQPLAASEITRAEVLQGMRSDERAQTADLLARCEWFAVDRAIATRAGEFGRRYRASHSGIDIADLIIAATADIHDLSLATSNVRHFPMFPDLEAAY